MAFKIFLSHSGADRAWVKWIAGNVRGIGIEPYLYEHDPQPGKNIAIKIQEAIGAADALVVLITHNSLASAYVQQEIGFAEATKKPIIPLVQPGTSTRSLAMLEGREYVVFDPQAPQMAVASLANYLNKLKKEKEQTQTLLLAVAAFFSALLLGASGRK